MIFSRNIFHFLIALLIFFFVNQIVILYRLYMQLLKVLSFLSRMLLKTYWFNVITYKNIFFNCLLLLRNSWKRAVFHIKSSVLNCNFYNEVLINSNLLKLFINVYFTVSTIFPYNIINQNFILIYFTFDEFVFNNI